MKTLSTTLVMLLIATAIIAQTPQAFKYQTVARDNTGQIIASQTIDLRFSIHDVSPAGTVVYQETHTATTNQFGLVNLEIGKGSNPIGSFVLIDWSNGSKFLEIEMDLSGGGTAYSTMGTTELLSVPFALHAQSATTAEDNDWTISGNDMYSNVSGNVGIGETAPGHKLTVNGGNAHILGSNGWTAPGHTANLYLGDPNYGIRAVEGEGLRLWAFDDFATDIRFQDHLGTDLMTIDMYWKSVGIGTTYPSDGKLVVEGGNFPGMVVSSDNYTALHAISTAGGGFAAGIFDAAAPETYGIVVSSSYESINTHASSTMGVAIKATGTGGAYAGIFNGNVGIGTDHPTNGLLEVEGSTNTAIYASSNSLNSIHSACDAGGGFSAGFFEATNPGTYGIWTQSDNYDALYAITSSPSHAAIRATGGIGAYAAIFNGNVGIGTNNPTNGLLEVEGGSNTAIYTSSNNLNSIHSFCDAGGGYAAGYFGATNPGTYGIWTESDDYDALYAYTSSPTHAAIRATANSGAYAGIFNGYVGIGTSNPVNGLLEVEGAGNTAIYASSNSLNTIHASCNAGGGFAAGFFEGSNPGTYGIWTQSNDYDALYAYTSSPSNAAIRAVAGSGAYAGIFQGNVGIGTDTPVGKLHAASTENYPGYFETSFTHFDSHVVHAIYTGGTADAKAIYGVCSPADFWGYGGSFHGGYTGVLGTVNPTGGNTYYGVAGYAIGGSGTNYAIYGSASGSGTNYAGYFAGDVTVTGTFTNPSDEKLKKNIQPFTNALSKINQLDVHQFEFRTDRDETDLNLPNGKQIGFTAQEMEQLFPELVADQVHSVDRNRGGNGMAKDIQTITYKGINYIGMIPVLTQALKEQQEIIEDLISRIEQLENQ